MRKWAKTKAKAAAFEIQVHLESRLFEQIAPPKQKLQLDSSWSFFLVVVKLEGKCWKRPNLFFVYENPTMFFLVGVSETTSDLLKRPNQTTNGKMGANQGKPGAACGDNRMIAWLHIDAQVFFRVNQPESYSVENSCITLFWTNSVFIGSWQNDRMFWKKTPQTPTPFTYIYIYPGVYISNQPVKKKPLDKKASATQGTLSYLYPPGLAWTNFGPRRLFWDWAPAHLPESYPGVGGVRWGSDKWLTWFFRDVRAANIQFKIYISNKRKN